jgi:hypothetical protein
MTVTTTYEQQLARLGEAIAAAGVGRFESELAGLASRARRHVVSPAAVEVLLDRSAPDVVRERAFAVVARGLVAAGSYEPTGELARVA